MRYIFGCKHGPVIHGNASRSSEKRKMTAFPELHDPLATLLDLPDVMSLLNHTKYMHGLLARWTIEGPTAPECNSVGTN